MPNTARTMPQAAPDRQFTEEGVVAKARELAARFAARLPQTLENRSVPAENIQELKDAGFFRILQAPRWGGYEVPYVLVARILEELAQGCPATSWVYGVLGTHNMFMSGWSEQAQMDVWGDDTEVLISSSFTPRLCKDVEGGIVLEGDWPFSSGCEHAGWVMIGAISPTRGPFGVLVPITSVEIVDDWHVMGLRGTGSKTVRLKDVFVPDHRMMPLGLIYACDRVSETYPDSFWDTHSIGTFGVFNFSCVASGIARKALALATQLIATPSHTGAPRGEMASIQMRFAEAAADIEMTADGMIESCRRLDRMWASGQKITELERLRHRRDICVMVWRLRQAVEKLTTFHNSWIYDTSPLQDCLRDIMVASAHRSANPEDTMLAYSKQVLSEALASQSH